LDDNKESYLTHSFYTHL